MKTSLRSFLALSVVILLCFFQKANATIRTFQFNGTTSAVNRGAIAGDAMVATLINDNASTPTVFGNVDDIYNFISYSITVAGSTYTASSGTLEVANSSVNGTQFVVSANGGLLQLSLENTNPVFSSLALLFQATMYMPRGPNMILILQIILILQLQNTGKTEAS